MKYAPASFLIRLCKGGNGRSHSITLSKSRILLQKPTDYASKEETIWNYV